MGFLGSVLGGPNTYQTLDNVKSQPLQNGINNQLDYFNKQVIPAGNAGYNSWLSQYNAYNPTAAANTGQEQHAIGGYYDGTVAGSLASLAANRQNAMLSAARLAQAQAIHNNNLSLLGQGGAGMGSYNNGLLARNMAGIATQTALDNAQQQQQNYQQVLGGQIGMAGQRTNLANALAMRAMQPWQTQAGMIGQNQGILSNFASLNNANNIYGLQMENRPGFAGFMDKADQGISNVFGMVGSAYSGGKTVQTAPGSVQPVSQGGGGFVPVGSFSDGSTQPSMSYGGTNLDGNYNPSSFSNSDIWGGGSAGSPSFANGFGSAGYPMASSGATGFGAGGDALSAIGSGYGN